jgi:hypothetical protein
VDRAVTAGREGDESQYVKKEGSEGIFSRIVHFTPEAERRESYVTEKGAI